MQQGVLLLLYEYTIFEPSSIPRFYKVCRYFAVQVAGGLLHALCARVCYGLFPRCSSSLMLAVKHKKGA